MLANFGFPQFFQKNLDVGPSFSEIFNFFFSLTPHSVSLRRVCALVTYFANICAKTNYLEKICCLLGAQIGSIHEEEINAKKYRDTANLKLL